MPVYYQQQKQSIIFFWYSLMNNWIIMNEHFSQPESGEQMKQFLYNYTIQMTIIIKMVMMVRAVLAHIDNRLE